MGIAGRNSQLDPYIDIGVGSIDREGLKYLFDMECTYIERYYMYMHMWAKIISRAVYSNSTTVVRTQR